MSIGTILKETKNIVSISKTSITTDYFGFNIPDIAIFEQLCKKQGYTDPIPMDAQPFYQIAEKAVKGDFPIMGAVEDSKKDIEDIDSKVAELEDKMKILEELNVDIDTKNKVLESLKGKYEAYIGAKNSLESMKDSEKYEEDMAKIQYHERNLVDNILYVIHRGTFK